MRGGAAQAATAPGPKIIALALCRPRFQCIYSCGAPPHQHNLVAHSLQIHSWMTQCRDGQEIVLMAIPIVHVFGMVAGMSFAVRSGASMVMIPNPRDLKDVLQNIDKYRPTVFPGVPTLYNAINNHPDVAAGKYKLTSIKACISGSAPLLRETKDRVEALTGGKLVEGFGLSRRRRRRTATRSRARRGPDRLGCPSPTSTAGSCRWMTG